MNIRSADLPEHLQPLVIARRLDIPTARCVALQIMEDAEQARAVHVIAAPPRETKMNKQEASYDRYLYAQRSSGLIRAYDFEPCGLRIGERCILWPDFRVVRADRVIEFHDVKALWKSKGRAHVEDDAMVKLKACARLHPYIFKIVWWDKAAGRWESREI